MEACAGILLDLNLSQLLTVRVVISRVSRRRNQNSIKEWKKNGWNMKTGFSKRVDINGESLCKKRNKLIAVTFRS